MPTGVKLTTEKKEQVVDIYKQKPITISNLSMIVGLSSPTIIKILDEYQIERYKKAKVYNPNLKEDYFDNIDSEAKAYFLGFIITDGNVFKPKDGNGQASISITQSSSDEYILEMFKKELNANTSIAHDGRGCSQFAVRSDLIASSLEKYGVVENKTLNTQLPKISDTYMPHLIRGILDGDGNISAHLLESNRFLHNLSFCGTHKLMQDISDYLSDELGVKNKTVYDYKDRHLSEVKWGSIHDMRTICDWMYNNATLYLKRKYNIYLEFLKHYY